MECEERRVAIYARLSDRHKNEKDNSIENQIALAREWICQKNRQGEGLTLYRTFVDCGYSGTTFHRPAFEEMLRYMQSGDFHILVCKDASRIGRDYLQTGEYLEKIFPRYGVRVVLVSSGYDSDRQMPGSLEGNLCNLMNEWYTRDIGQKVRLVKQKQREKGWYLGSRAPYGYRVVTEEGMRRLEEDEEAIRVRRQIQAWYSQGKTLQEIRDCLAGEKIVPPGVYGRTHSIHALGEECQKWDRSTIRRMLS